MMQLVSASIVWLMWCWVARTALKWWPRANTALRIPCLSCSGVIASDMGTVSVGISPEVDAIEFDMLSEPQRPIKSALVGSDIFCKIL